MSVSKKINNCQVRLLKGDISDMEFESFVFYAQDNLKLGAGFGNAIAMRAGLSVQKELDQIGGLGLTEAVVSKAGKLKAEYIIHANGPKFQEEDIENKLRQTIVKSLMKAEEAGIKQVAFPPMGTGFYGIPVDVCARVTIEAFKHYLSNGSKLEDIAIVAMDNREYDPFAEAMKEL
ncbi:MAG: macro domain-containing protein [FCB group bacterium]|nr:macro domain-containing protein [FCB group bacterium]